MSAVTNWDRLDGKISAEDYARHHAESIGLTLEQFDRWMEVVPCDCGEEGCEGWAARSRQRPNRKAAYRP